VPLDVPPTSDNAARPFVYEKLVARMRAVLRRTARPRHPRMAVGDLAIDLASRVVRVGGDPVQLSAKEFDLLVALAEDPERVFRKEELLRDVWGFRSLGSVLVAFGPVWHHAPNGQEGDEGRGSPGRSDRICR
jgi:DNA-binding response OmpR family regulator